MAKLLMSDQLPTPSWWKRLDVRFHLAMCRFCPRLARQFEQLRSAARGMSEQEEADFEDRLIRRLSGQ